ncbi:hypothetical protein VOLCADRAFT_81789 [Volvox carteri f. nagariensis]|uniref:SNF2 family DNA-dependent ATPase n=1 Tax=Volvox carteri f. nagariensis TaxID=3068 RepID=D8U0Q4_VOLCA|nr:uncharacterized protein VOLCADRAFT_81789 [Volvox carteri f. nagariensis]EFJ46678.1 hypothetical protein VOLCADRAFT_81789 [Volvox carteri f. nagariensis]|eukprot:XP_002952207.1 hypothetical protein VOLCADRAFT_81789 [Volvox carteri f. nagariensis]
MAAALAAELDRSPSPQGLDYGEGLVDDRLVIEERELYKKRIEAEAIASDGKSKSDDIDTEEDEDCDCDEEDGSKEGAGPAEDGGAKLLELVGKSQMYSSWLADQFKDVVEQTLAAAAAGAVQSGVEERPSKRRKTGRGKLQDNAKPAVPSATKVLLPLITADLRDYQLKGVAWLISLYKNGVNGILADEMGLGKTLQTISFISYLWGHAKDVSSNYMVIGPLSTLSNWVAEFNRFCPSIPVQLYHGTPPERESIRRNQMSSTDKQMPVIVTSYEIAMADRCHLERHKWKLLVVDEGHRLKNFDCKLLRELRRLKTDSRLLLTGTPLQNNLRELWSLLSFCMPNIFADAGEFLDWFDFRTPETAIPAAQQQARATMVSRLHAILKPFVLRRVKADVEIGVPPKQEVVLYAEMTEEQRRLTRGLIDARTIHFVNVQEEYAKDGVRGSLNNLIMQMRKVCNHPDLITGRASGEICYPPAAELVAECGKLALLDRLLKELRKGGHRVLIFSQMTEMLNVIEAYLQDLGIQPLRIDGSVHWQQRRNDIAEFQSGNSDKWVFLLSTRAGGLGINLTAADTVIIYDSDWNPHQDAQAMDRCHRIGQTKPVLVFRLVTSNSVENRMLAKAESKKALERIVIKKGAFKELLQSTSSTSVDELVQLLNPDRRSQDLAQSGVVSDQMLRKLLDRSHLAMAAPDTRSQAQDKSVKQGARPKGDKPLCDSADKKGARMPPYPLQGVGYEVVLDEPHRPTGLLQTIDGQ